MKYLVLCTGNRCRSQMAQGILQYLYPEAEVCSAGVRPASEVHPLAIKVMAEIGIDISGHYPKNVDYTGTIARIEEKNTNRFMEEVLRKI